MSTSGSPSKSRAQAGFGLWGYSGVARLRSGVTLDDARAELSALIRDLPTAFPNDALVAGNVESKLDLLGTDAEGRDGGERRARAVDSARGGWRGAAGRVRERRQSLSGSIRGAAT